jgi:hypothetical protein
MSSAFVSKSRRVRFELTLRIVDLNNVPLVSGTSFIKWHLPSSTAAEHRGRTSKCPIRDHRVAYDYEKQLDVRLTVGRDSMLQECSIEFEVIQEYNASGRGERIRLGEVKLNLAEYVEASELQSPGATSNENREEGIVRRYLMQESKINSTLKVGVYMRYVEGTRDYHAPPLRSAPVFGGIAGIISSSDPIGGGHAGPSSLNPDADGAEGTVPNLLTTNKETGEIQDMYRRTLAAFWTSQPGELKADECIEDIFSGGDGWGKNGRPKVNAARDGKHGDSEDGDQSRPGSGSGTPSMDQDPTPRPTKNSRSARKALGMSTGRGKHDRTFQGKREIDELDVVNDLRSWTIGKAYS